MLRNSSSGIYSKTPRIKRQIRKYSSVDSSISDDEEDDDDDDEEDDDDDDIEIDADDDDHQDFNARMSIEFTKFMDDPRIKEG